MEYVQLTINDYMEYKNRLLQELNNLANGFIKTGYYLKKIRDSEAYRNDGYASIYEFAQKEYGITRTVAARFMSINDKFSEDGYSLELMEQYKGFGSSRLTEMLSLPVEDHEMVTNITRIEDIRELKRFEKQEPGTEQTSYKELFRNFFEGKEKEFNAVMQLDDIRDIAEIVNPSGNKTWKYRTLFMAMKEYDKGISIKDYNNLTLAPDTISWEQFVRQCRELFIYEPEAGTPYEQNYQPENLEEEEDETDKSSNEEKSAENGIIPQHEGTFEPAENEPETEEKTEIIDENIQNVEEITVDEPETEENEDENKVCDLAQDRINPQHEDTFEPAENEPETEPQTEVCEGTVEEDKQPGSDAVHLSMDEYTAVAQNRKRFIVAAQSYDIGSRITIRVKFNRAFSDIRALVTYAEKSEGLLEGYSIYGIEVQDEKEE